jgi:DNA-directed RNA polymerase specialized sigma24 family protein
MAPVAPAERVPGPATDAVREAFRELHGQRLHGFALLLTLGDRPAAARLASEALAAGAVRLDELRHPERAAAWLRRRIVRDARIARNGRIDAGVMRDLGAAGPVATAIGSLDRLERAALISSGIERFDPRDVATIVGRDGSALERLLRRARERYLRAHATAADDPTVDGPIAEHVRTLARRALP